MEILGEESKIIQCNINKTTFCRNDYLVGICWYYFYLCACNCRFQNEWLWLSGKHTPQSYTEFNDKNDDEGFEMMLSIVVVLKVVGWC